MKKYGGYLIHFDEPNRVGRLLQELVFNGKFTDTLSAPDWKPKELEICFLSWDGQSFAHAGLVRRGRHVATAKYRVEFFSFVTIEPSLSFSDLHEHMRMPIEYHLIAVSMGNGVRLSPEDWGEFLSVVKKLRPRLAHDLDLLERKRLAGAREFTHDGFETVAQEKDAVSLAASIAGFDRTEVLGDYAAPDANAPAPFLQGLSRARLREDTMLFHDARVLPGWKEIEKYNVGATEFEKEGRKLTVMNVNRTRVEESLGVDLIYYQHTFDAFILVQYKRMRRGDDGKPSYRPSDAAFKAEIARMREFKKVNAAAAAPKCLKNYRLNNECFYFKLCDEVTFSPYSKDLIGGMYLPLEYWDLLQGSPAVRGRNGGLVFSYKTVKRYLTNTGFIGLMQESWIGSCGGHSKALSKLIHGLLDESHSVILAVEEEDVEPEE